MLDALDVALHTEVTRIAREDSERGCEVEWRLDTDAKATVFDKECIGCVSDSAEAVVGRNQVLEITSGAGHDRYLTLTIKGLFLNCFGVSSCMTALRCPTSMVFVPSKDGISHNPVEYTSPEDCAIGTQVILGALLRFDELRAKKAQAV